MTVGIILGAATLIAFAWLVARIWTRIVLPEIRPDYAWGDVVEVPPELRPARKGYGGGESGQGGRADTHSVIAHDGSVTKP